MAIDEFSVWDWIKEKVQSTCNEIKEINPQCEAEKESFFYDKNIMEIKNMRPLSDVYDRYSLALSDSTTVEKESQLVEWKDVMQLK